VTSTRAILVTQAQRDDVDVTYSQWGDGMSTSEHAALGDVVDAYDNAGDQPRIRWCVEHSRPVDSCQLSLMRRALTEANFKVPRCRVVTAIIVPVEEDA
jgi:hypothetical protein